MAEYKKEVRAYIKNISEIILAKRGLIQEKERFVSRGEKNKKLYNFS